jgi:fimbrial isopeptide formation D2 family protein
MWVGNVLTVTYPSIPHDEQRLITVTAVVSGPTGVLAGQSITNVATLEHSQGVTESDRPVFTVTEPALTLVKASTPPTSNTGGVGQMVTYTLSITNSAAITASAAYDLLITDTLPAHVTLAPPIPVSVEIDGSAVAPGDVAVGYAGGLLTLDFEDAVALGQGAVLTVLYHGQVDADVPHLRIRQPG